jgi:hypothetical protein
MVGPSEAKTPNVSETVAGERAITETLPAAELDLISIPERERDIEKAIEAVEKQVAFFKKIRLISLKLTNPKDWIVHRREGDAEGSPFLMDRGAELIRLAWGIDVSGLQLSIEWAEDPLGKYFTYVATGKAYSKKLNAYLEDIGTCSQRDQFFGKVAGKWRQIEEVDMTDIRKKAVTNLYNRLIKRMAGLLNITLDDLHTAGFKIEDLPVAEFRRGGQKRDVAPTERTEKAKDLEKEITEIAAILSDGDPELAAGAIKQSSSFVGTDKKERYARAAKDITSERWLNTTYGRIKDMLASVYPEEFKKRYPGEPLPKTRANNGGQK